MTTTIITGGTGGIGVATARRLLEDAPTHCIALVDLRDDALPRALEPFADRVAQYACDVVDPVAVRAAASLIGDQLPPVSGLVNSAGTLAIAPSLEIDAAEFESLLSVHLTGALLWSQAFARLLEVRPGAIVNLSSIAGQFGQPGRLAYGAAKAAIRSMTQTLAVEWATRGIRVNCVAPGYIETPMLTQVRTAGRTAGASLAQHAALNRVGQPGEVAGAIAFLLGDDASFITGHTLNVDGGFSVKKVS